MRNKTKQYEAVYDTRVESGLPVVVRLDGRSFKKFTEGMDKPFDSKFSSAMVNTAKYLVRETGAKIAYTQSDEISLLLTDGSRSGSTPFNGRVQNLCSVFASLASVYFLTEVMKHWPDKMTQGNLPVFDCRVFTPPLSLEVYEAFLSREKDAINNSVLRVAHAHFSHEELLGLSARKIKEKLLVDKGINWDYFPAAVKRGSWVRRETIFKPLSSEELTRIPQKYRPFSKYVNRAEIVEFDMRGLASLSNPIAVLFDGATPNYHVETVVIRPVKSVKHIVMSDEVAKVIKDMD